ncbi:MAG TPA: hypothetical protein VFW96_09650 [Thermomicrobiales bacterium]|nr:hypothetical protein [Thermomicrobiales bacterium]
MTGDPPRAPAAKTAQAAATVTSAASPRARRRRRRAAPALSLTRLLDPRRHLPALLLVAALATLFCWQARRPFALAVGAPNDDPYLSGFQAAEVAPGGALAYRWTTGRATIAIPGYGATAATLTLRLQGARPDGAPPPAVRVAVGNRPPVALQLTPELQDYQLAVPPAAFDGGDLRVTLDAPTFRPAGDRRDLGVLVAGVELRDAGAPAGLVAPPWRALGTVLLLVLLAYAVPALALGAPVAGAAAGWAALVALAVFALRSRFELARYAPALCLVAAGVGVATLVAAWALRAGGRRWGWAASPRALGGAALIAGVLLLALLVGMRHPQFRSSDLVLNVHRLEFVRHGDWVFTLALPGPRALEAPYPPAFYAAMLPFSYVVGDGALLVEATAAAAIVAGALLTFALARRLTGADGAALWAAGISAVVPITYAMVSAGNFANLFGQGLADAYLVALILSYGRWRAWPVAAGLTALLVAAFLGHFGVFLSLLVAVPLGIVALLACGRDGAARGQAGALAASFAVALVAAFALYYRFHAALLLGYARDALGGRLDARGGAVAQPGLLSRLRGEWDGFLLWWGWVALPLGLGGAVSLWRARRSPQLALALAWLATAVVFVLVELVAGLSVRYHLFVLPPLAVAAGWLLWLLWQRRRYYAGPALALALGAFWLWQGLVLWVDRVLHAYH